MQRQNQPPSEEGLGAEQGIASVKDPIEKEHGRLHGYIVPDEAVILLVEDREDDIHLIKRAFARGGINNPLQIVRDGDEAMAYLAGGGKYSNRAEYPLPDLVLLDLKMPRVDGFEVMQWIRKQPGFASLCVVVLTSSDAIRDVNRAYALGANSFLVKPLEFENTIETARMLKTYWLRMNKRPEAERSERPSKSVVQ